MQPLTLHNCLYLRNLGLKVSDFGTLLDHVNDPQTQTQKKIYNSTPIILDLKNNPPTNQINIKNKTYIYGVFTIRIFTQYCAI
jgi:hypothetical protein